MRKKLEGLQEGGYKRGFEGGQVRGDFKIASSI